jgi:hypothetical protein
MSQLCAGNSGKLVERLERWITFESLLAQNH